MRKEKLTYEYCLNESKKYKTRSEFKRDSGSAYGKCIKSKWYDIISTIELKNKPKNFWTKENCTSEALKFNNRSDFAKGRGHGYQTALINGWLDEICSHMIVVGNYRKRCIYVYEFNDNYAYVGLTYNLFKRHNRRLSDKNDPVYIHYNINPNFNLIQLTDYIDVNEAKKLENQWLEYYKKNDWIILNRNKTGSLGGNSTKWTYEECKKESMKYNTHIEFKRNNNNCVHAIYKNKWHELLKHLKYDKRPNKFWTYEKCLESANKCISKTEFCKNFKGAYASAKYNNWYDEICLITNLANKKPPQCYEIDDDLFHKVHNDRMQNKKTFN